MLLTSIDPFVQEFERQFDRAVRQAGLGSGAGMPMDGIRRADDVVLRFDLPGVDPGSIEVTVDRGVLSVTARREEEFGEDERVFVRERPMGSFTRRVYLSEHLDAEAVEAAYNNGVLAVRIPVLERAKPRKVAVQQSGDGPQAIKS
ncbi:Hsp20/alpha crystallin family protein [Actinomadura madurae]|uniref:Hsp20/alpha crystallin family protein n=1 Tax=Actinomadura madurae TaxID=1993 RepID=UPI002025F835|nr:Hsp20/alpha crystallin family protein [Actinomadura madurae]MCP9949995.1 Hsp20/alpha crystallin family protein [Actinomadura madurae]MCP9966751.1 Hsp20/alpha crystallin family protein [Actinomadura madurae]MCP9979238.1 Hsp20/alpha crystallin family protein [Actinomadura madurae]MCQ0009234.1 Hsp20/alpha crystallin family protein [Actinomadura madurae]MCQ0015434.1 Hsp20/alpha crystallin family protein [Actinomadura madurae]